jgi:hypothetical protein
MNVMALGLSVASCALVLTTVVLYFRTVPEGHVRPEITDLVVKMLAGLALAATAIGWQLTAGAGVVGTLIVGAPAAFAMMLATMLLYFLSQRMTPVGDLKVSVGDPLLAFSAATAEGTPFHTDQLAGKRTLLKFFRGGW